MKKRIYGMLLMGAMVIASVSMFTSCKDYDDDINDLQKQIDALNVSALQTTVSNLQSELTSQKGTVAALETQIAKANQGVDAVSGQLDNFASKADLAAAVEELAKATATQEAVEAALAKAQEALDVANEAKDAAGKGGVTEADLKALEDQIAKVSAAVAAIDPKLDAIGKWQESVNGILEAVQKNVKTQQDALDNLKKALEEVGNNAALKALVDELKAKVDKAATADDVKKAIDDLKANLGEEVAKAVADIQKNLQDADIQTAKNLSDAKKELTQTMQGLSDKVDDFSANINALTVFVKRNLTSLVFRPDTYYGGIEGVEIFSFNVKNEQEGGDYHWFDMYLEPKRYTLSDYGYANYHVNPTNVDLTNTKIDFYSWVVNLKEPVVGDGNETTRSGANWIKPVYEDFDSLYKNNAGCFANGILTVPFQASITDIYRELTVANRGTIMSLQMTKQNEEGNDTTVTSDYAIVYPVIAEELLICDKTFKPTGPGAATADHIDDIKAGQNTAGNDLTPNSYHLHRNFSYLAMATTPATHKVKYDESLNISKLLETHYLDQFAIANGVAIVDTARNIARPSTAEINNGNVAFDSNASITKAAAADGKLHCGLLSAEAMERLGLVYDVHLVDYTLGSNVTGESVHMEVLQNEKGEFVAYPRDVTAAGKTITGTTATPASVGRMPILCIELKDTKHDNRTVTFAWMKLLISDKVVNPEQKTVDFELGDYYMDCDVTGGALTWSQVEYNLLRTLGMSKETFDATFTYDWIPNTDVTQAKTDVSTTTYIKSREGYQFAWDEENGVFVKQTKVVATPGAAAYTCPTQDEKNYYQRHGKVTEEWNVSDQGVEDATTHILRWSFNEIEKFALYKYLKTSKGGGLKDNGNDWVNKKDFSTYVRYQRNNATGEPAVYIKLTIPAGKIHFAKGNLDGNKILSFWYNLNSKTNAENDSKAKEVRINVPVPTPAAPLADVRTFGPGDAYTWSAPLQVDQDNLLQNTEFVKDLHDFFKNGKLGASIKEIGGEQKFPGLAASALIPEFEFILPSKDLGNATFDASSKGTWNVRGFSGSIYTLGIFFKGDPTSTSGEDAGNEIRIISGKYPDGTDIVIPVYPGNILASISDDNDGHVTPATPIQSVVKFHGGGDNQSAPLNWLIAAPKHPLQDDILNAASHNDLLESGFSTKATAPKSGANQTFTAYVGINIPTSCVPVTFDDMWFNVRFIRPLDLDQPAGALMTDAPNDWQKVNIMNFSSVTDWRDYKGDKTDATGGNEVFAAGKYWFDYKYYGVSLSTSQNAVLTDAFLGTDDREKVASTAANLISIDAYAMSQLENVSAIPNFQLELDPADATGRTIRYKNNSGINGGFHIFIPVYMEYVFGTQTVKQVKYITVGIQKSVAQPQARVK